MPTPRADTRTLEKRRLDFLAHFEDCGNIRLACKLARIGRSTVYEWRDQDEAFAAAFAEAASVATESLEAEAYRRAVKGTLKPVYQGGERVGAVREYSDTLLIFLLKGRAPEKYRERASIEHSGTLAALRIITDEPSS